MEVIFLRDRMRRLLPVLAVSGLLVMSGCADLRLLAATMKSTSSPAVQEEVSDSAASKTAAKIMDRLGLSGTMSALKERNMRSLVFQGNEIYSDGVIYLSQEGKSDSVGVFFVTDLEEGKRCVEEYVTSLKAQTNVYDSSEIFKISNAVIADNGSDEIILIICADIEKAKSLAAEITGS